MRKLLAFLLFTLPALAQSPVIGGPVQYVLAAPSGSCGAAPPIEVLFSNGLIYTCDNGTWTNQTSGGGPPSGAAGGVLSGTYPNPGYAVAPLPLSGGTPVYLGPTYYASQQSGADVSVQTQNCLNAAIAVHGTCDASMFSGNYTGLTQVLDIGDSAGDGVRFIPPYYGTWTWGNMTTSRCLVNQHNQSVIDGAQTGLGTAYTFSFVAGATTTAAGVFCQSTTDTSQSFGIYETTKGFGAQAVSGATLTNSASITASFSAYVLTVTAISSGFLAPGQTITGAGITPTVEIVAPLSVNAAGIGTYSLYGNASGSVGPETMTASQNGALIFLNGLGDGSIVEGLGALGGSTTNLYGVNAQNMCCGATVKDVASYGSASTFTPMILHWIQMGAEYEDIALSGNHGGNNLVWDGITGYGIPNIRGLYMEGPTAMTSNRVEVTSPAVASTIFGINLSDVTEGNVLSNATGYAVDVQSGARANLHNISPANQLAVNDHNGVGYPVATGSYVGLDYSTPRWYLVKDTYANVNCTTSTSCTLTIQAVGRQPGVHVLVAMVDGYGTDFHISAFTATGGTQTLCAASACAGTTGSRIVDTAAVIGVNPGVTSASLTFSTGPQYSPPVDVREYVWTGNTVAYDTGNYAGSASCSSCTAPALTLGGNDVAVVQSFSDNNITAITGCFAQSVSGLATPAPEAGCANQLSYSAPTLTQASAGAFSSSAMALKGQ